MQIAVIGPADCTPEEWRAARETGRLIAQKGAVLVSGGLGGVMEASCQGAKESGGRTVGILPGTSGGNQFLDISIRTGLGHARNFLVVQSGDSVIAIGGDGRSFGTLSEIGIAIKTGKKVFGWCTWDIPGVTACESPEVAALSAVRVSRP
ncbi:MAG: TIGR00725 family protein [Methanoregulaceae archaeon]|nr:TIGR00725 family protein [Methanoregulaceae archaeon]